MDVAIVGGGLAGGLLALRLKQSVPSVGLTLFEASESLGGNHTWSFHDADLTPAQRDALAPLIEARWERQAVRFVGRQRELASGYQSILSERFDANLRQALGESVRFRAPVARASQRMVELSDGQRVVFDFVFDARGDAATEAGSVTSGLSQGDARRGFQKFVGLELECESAHELKTPILMWADREVAQTDGYCFYYCLPFSGARLLLEETHYSDEPMVDVEAYRARILAFAEARGWKVKRVIRQEVGVLPIPLTREAWGLSRAVTFDPEQRVDQARHEDGSACAIGARAGWYHPATGYSLPWAVRFADQIAALFASDPSSKAVGLPMSMRLREAILEQARAFSDHLESKLSFGLFLNRLLFEACPAERRHEVLEAFYGLPESTIERFYSGAITRTDRLRILALWPKAVPLKRALRSLIESN